MAKKTNTRKLTAAAPVGESHGTRALGPSDSSDSGSDVQGGHGAVNDERLELDTGTSEDATTGGSSAGPDLGDAKLESDSDSGGTGERSEAGRESVARQNADIMPDRIDGDDALGLGADPEAAIGVFDEEPDLEIEGIERQHDPDEIDEDDESDEIDDLVDVLGEGRMRVRDEDGDDGTDAYGSDELDEVDEGEAPASEESDESPDEAVVSGGRRGARRH